MVRKSTFCKVDQYLYLSAIYYYKGVYFYVKLILLVPEAFKDTF